MYWSIHDGRGLVKAPLLLLDNDVNIFSVCKQKYIVKPFAG